MPWPGGTRALLERERTHLERGHFHAVVDETLDERAAIRDRETEPLAVAHSAFELSDAGARNETRVRPAAALISGRVPLLTTRPASIRTMRVASASASAGDAS